MTVFHASLHTAGIVPSSVQIAPLGRDLGKVMK